MFLVSLAVLIPVLYLASGEHLPVELVQELDKWLPNDGQPTDQFLALAFIAGALVGATPLHVLLRYMSTVVHELGHAFTAGVLGGRPKNITIEPSSSGLATYQPPISWGRGRASLVSLAGYPAPAVASLAAVQALILGRTIAWFFFATATLAISILLLIRNLWGFVWTSAVVALAYYASEKLDLKYLAVVVASIAGYLAIESVRHSSQQLSIIKRVQGSGCDAERVAFWWGLPPRLVATSHMIISTAVSCYACYLAINPYWDEIFEYVRKFTATST
jgi:hypothetical protein